MEPLGIEGILTHTGVQEGFDGAGRGMDAVVGQLPVLQCDRIGAKVIWRYRAERAMMEFVQMAEEWLKVVAVEGEGCRGQPPGFTVEKERGERPVEVCLGWWGRQNFEES
jgi:hypothetical protein